MLWISNGKVYSQYPPNFFWKRWTCKNCYSCFASAVMNIWSYVWFYLSQSFKSNASFYTGTRSAPGKQAVNLLMNNFRIWNFHTGANYQAKNKSLDCGISLPPILLQILYGFRGNSFALLWEFGSNIPKTWQQ